MEDALLWEKFKQGDKTALSQIFNQHVRLLYKYGRKFTVNDALVEDCIQDLFLEIWKNRQNLGKTDSIKLYLLSSLRRKIIRKSTSESKKYDKNTDVENYNFEVEFTPEDMIISDETNQLNNQKLQGQLQKLSKRQKEAIYLKYYQGLEYNDISSIMDINYQSARNLVYSALKALKKNFLAWALLVSSGLL